MKLKDFLFYILILPSLGGWLFNEIDLKNKLIILCAWLILWSIIALARRFKNNFLRFINLVPSWIIKFLNMLWSPVLRIIYITSLLSVISWLSTDFRIYIISSIIFLIYILSFSIKEIEFKKAPFFSDGFDDDLFKKWSTISGNPNVDKNFGPSAPSLVLPFVENQPENSYILVKDVDQFRNGIIECDVYLKPNAVMNLIFRASRDGAKGYIARLDSRGGGDPDRFLKKTDKNSWNSTKDGKTQTFPEKWHHIRLQIRETKFELYRNETLICEWENDEFTEGRVGIFNECNEVHVDNFVITRF